MDHRVAIGSWFGNQDITQISADIQRGWAIGNRLAAVSPAVPARSRVT